MGLSSIKMGMLKPCYLWKTIPAGPVCAVLRGVTVYERSTTGSGG